MAAVLFIGEQGDGALTLYRALLPAQGLANRYGYTCWHRRVLFESDDRRLRGWDGPGTHWTPVPKYVICRHMKDVEGKEIDSAVMFEDARSSGQAVFVDMDDDLFNLPAWNPAAIMFRGEQLQAVRNNCDAASGVLVSTGPLAEVVREQTETPVHVCPNSIDVTPYRLKPPDRDPLRVAWIGMTDWRINDLAMVGTQIVRALDGRSVELWHLGHQDHRLPIESALGDDAVPVPIVRRDFVVMSRLPDLLTEIDLALIPMQDIALNRSRSATTGLACAAAGVPVLASPMPAYCELYRAGGCLLVEDDYWEQTIRSVLDWTPATRAELGRDARKAVARHYRPADAAAAWHEAFTSARPRGQRLTRTAGSLFRHVAPS